MKIPFLDLKKINSRFHSDFEERFSELLDSGRYLSGQFNEEFSRKFSDFNSSEYALGVANGLDALKLILLASGVEKGDEVIVPANTFIATVLAISDVGATPILVEPNLDDYMINCEEVERAITKRTKAILAVHLYGNVPDMDRLNSITAENGIMLLADAAQAHGATYKGKRLGELCLASAFSFYPGKNLGCLGDGGGLITNSEDIYLKAKALANYGSDRKYHHIYKGINSRLDEIQAAFLTLKLEKLEEDNNIRRKIAHKYLTEIKNDRIVLPVVSKSVDPVWHVFPVRVGERNKFRNYLEQREIETIVHYPTPPHLQLAYEELNSMKFPITEKIHKEIVSIPISPVLEAEEIDYLIQTVNAYEG